MTTEAPAVLCCQYRGAVLETTLRGHVVVVSAHGGLMEVAGHARAVTTLRSSFKPFQAAALIELGAFKAFDLGPESIALAAGSHMGEPAHIDAVRQVLMACGLTERALKCGTHRPESIAAADSLLKAGTPFSPVHNNCSGKHAAMLAACVAQRWPLDSYLEAEHPLQVAIAAYFSRWVGIPRVQLREGVDGCGVPTFGVSLLDFARALARAAAEDPAMAEALAAMSSNPYMVGGSDSFDTAFMEATSGSWVAKTGAEGVFCAVRLRSPLVVVLKFESGDLSHLPLVATRAFSLAGLLSTPELRRLDRVSGSSVYNWSGTCVGRVKSEFVFE